jgi:hypothetical protein
MNIFLQWFRFLDSFPSHDISFFFSFAWHILTLQVSVFLYLLKLILSKLLTTFIGIGMELLFAVSEL